MSVVTSSGFLFDRRGSTVVLQNCPRELVAAAELEYLREVEPRAAGRIRGVARGSQAGREVHVIDVHLPGAGGDCAVTFDVGPAALGRLRLVHEAIGLAVYGLGGVTALATVGYLVAQFFG